MSVPTLLRRRRRRLQPLTAGTHSPQVRAALPWLVVSLGLTMSALIGQVPLWTLLIFAGCAGWRQWLERRGALPSPAVRLAVFLPSVAGVFLVYGTRPGAQGMLALLATLLSLKMLELRNPRDLIIVALLGYFMVLSAFFYDQSLGLSLYLCVAVLLNTVALIRAHSGARTLWPTLRLALGLGLQALPLVVLLFVIFPRLQGTFFRRLGGATTGLTGMNEHLEPGSFSSLVQSEQPAFRVKIVSGEGPALRYLYWRGLVLDVCEKPLSWRASETRFLPPSSRNPLAAPAGGRIEQFVTLMPHGRNWLFALDHPVDIAPSATLQPHLLENNLVRSGHSISGSPVAYTVFSQFSASSPISLGPYRSAAMTSLPPDISPRVLELVAGWKKQAKSPEDVIRVARNFFRDGGFVYTLNPGSLPRENALDYFLFKSRRGFCEHYAAAFSMLMRAAGIPARIVIGYQGGEFNNWGGYYTVRQSDAHAWSEVWIKDKGWQREDPTAVVAPERLSFGADSYAALSAFGSLSAQSRLEQLSRLSGQGGWRGLERNLLLAWDSIDQQWNVKVLGYDQEQQSGFMQGLGLGDLGWLASITLSVAGVFGALMLATGFMRGFGGERAAIRKDPARQLYQRFCERAAAATPALRRAEAEGPLDFAARAREVLPDCAEQIGAITDLYVASRYAPAGPGHAETLTDLRRAVTGFHPAKRKV